MEAWRQLTAFLRTQRSDALRDASVPWKLFDDFYTDSNLLPWAAINSFLQTHWHDEELVRMARGHQPVDRHQYIEPNRWRGRLRLDRFYEELDKGASLVFENAGRSIPLISMIEQEYERILQDEVASQLFIANPKTQGFGPHWDGYDVFVTQLNGSRRWSIYGITRTAPILEDFEFPSPPDHPPGAEIELRPGNTLFLPRGCWHDVHAPDSHSVHVTVAVSRRTGLDFIQWIAEDIRRCTSARSDLPRTASVTVQEEYLSALKTEIGKYLTVEGLSRYFHREDAFAPARPIFSAHRAVTRLDNLTVRSLVPRARLARTASGIQIYADGREIDVLWTDPPANLIPPLTRLVTKGGPCTHLSDDLPWLSDRQIIELLKRLTKLGLIALGEEQQETS